MLATALVAAQASVALAGPAGALAGTLDRTFGTGGKVTTDFAGSFDQANALVLQANGKLVAAGIAYTESDSAFVLARYRAR